MKTIMTNFASILAIGIALTASVADATGDKEGNGGGMICIAKKCMTLAEAGFKPSQGGRAPELENEVIAELEKIVALFPPLPQSDDISKINIALTVEEIIGKKGDINFIESADPKKIDDFLSRYREILVGNDSTLTAQLEIAGFTEADKFGKRRTYLIVDKFNQLSNWRSKALLLIHEYSLRVRGKSLREALLIDSAILNFIEATDRGDVSKLEVWNILKLLYPAGQWQAYIIGDIINRNGPMSPRTLFSNESTTLVLNYGKLLQNREIDQDISKFLEPTRIQVRYVSRADLLQGFIASGGKKEAGMTVVYTRNQFAEYIQNLLIRQPELRESFEQLKRCSIAAEDATLVATPVDKDSIFHLPSLAYCGVQGAWTTYYNKIADGMGPYLDGLELNIPGKLVCKYTDPDHRTIPTCHLKK
jgi:hypothetical protein